MASSLLSTGLGTTSIGDASAAQTPLAPHSTTRSHPTNARPNKPAPLHNLRTTIIYTTDTITVAAEHLLTITNALAEAKADSALLIRLKDADARVKRLTAEQASAIVRQDMLLDAEAKEIEAARFKGIGKINVTDQTPEESVLRSSYLVSYTTPAYDMNINANVTQTNTVIGFKALSHDVLACLIERQPTQIPAKIASLAADPSDAFQRYFIGLKRGHLTA